MVLMMDEMMVALMVLMMAVTLGDKMAHWMVESTVQLKVGMMVD